MSESTVYECPECEDRKMVYHTEGLSPTVWCACNGFVIMDIVEQ